MGALDGFRFRVDGETVAARYAGWLLAGMGAEVEALADSDLHRTSALHAWLTADTQVRPRREGEALEADAAGLDAIIADTGEQLRPARLAALEALHARHPELVVTAVSPFGLTGPLAHQRATPYELQCLSGIAHYIGDPNGPPMPMGGHVIETATGANAVLAALLAVRRRRRGGHGALADVSMLETGHCLQAARAYTYAYTGLVLRRVDTTNSGYTGFLACKDGYINLTPSYTPWSFFTGLLGVEDADFGGDVMALPEVLRYSHPRTTEILARVLPTKTRWEWTRESQTWRIPCVPIQTPDDFLGDEQFACQGFFRDFAFGGRVLKVPGRPFAGEAWGRSDRPKAALPPPPAPGADCLALDDVNVLEFGIGWSAPMSAIIMAQHGATVVRVESPTKADTSRLIPLLDLEVREPWYEWSYNHHGVNSGKRHLACNLTGARGPEVRERLLRWADVLVTNYSPRALENLGLDGPAVAKVNPRCTTVNSTSFGFDGPYRDFVAYGTGMEGMTGVASATGEGHPYRSTMLHPDIYSALHNCVGAIASLLDRERTGRGTWVDLRQYECAVAAMAEPLLDLQLPAAERSPRAALHAVIPTAGDDQWVAVTVASADEWRAAGVALGGGDRLPPWPEALAGRAGAKAALGALSAVLPRDEAAARLVAAGLPAAPVLAPDEVLVFPHLHARGFFTRWTHEPFGTRMGMGYWSQLRGRPLAHLRGVRRFGEDNTLVLTELLGFAPAEAAAMQADGTVATQVVSYERTTVACRPIDAQIAEGHIYRRDPDHARRLGLV